MNEAPNKVVISNLTKSYGKTIGIENLNLSIKEGEIFGFLGPNGAGKTTTIRCILNILIPDKGTIKIKDALVSRNNAYLKEDIGYLPGELYFPKSFTVKNLLDYVESLKKKPCTRRQELIERFKLETHKKIQALSHGNKQKLGIVLAFMHNPSLIILDEPSSGLDPLLQQTLYDLILEEKKKGKSIFFSSHNLDEVQKICDRVAIIRKGNLISVDNVTDLSKKVSRHLTVFVNPNDIATIKKAGIEMTQKGNEITFLINEPNILNKVLKLLSEINVKDILFPPAKLEDFFLQQYQ
jgi:beta-exotoxin I transport system ATP-binding protein